MATVPSLVALTLPGRCASCNAWGAAPLCDGCARSVRWTPDGGCACCRGIDDPTKLYGHVHTAALYGGAAREALKAFKLLGERRTARWLAAHLARACGGLEAQVVTWVPSTRAAEAARGFNPAEELARPVARALRLPSRRLLRKRRDTHDSAGLTREQRRVNLLDAFEAKGRVAGHVLLVDDIFTTGATAAECALALRRGGAREVSIAAFARAP